MKTKYIIFDLDDTLIYEIEYLKSAYQEIASFLANDASVILYEKMFHLYQTKQDVFKFLIEEYPTVTLKQLLDLYRNHIPTLNLNEGAIDVLTYLKSKEYKLGLITDGRSITQRNKLKSVNLEQLFDKIVISEEIGSEKPNRLNFEAFLDETIDQYYYIGDNPRKDFITPNQMNWVSVCLLDKGFNIHFQDFNQEVEYLPQIKITSLVELIKIIS